MTLAFHTSGCVVVGVVVVVVLVVVVPACRGTQTQTLGKRKENNKKLENVD